MRGWEAIYPGVGVELGGLSSYRTRSDEMLMSIFHCVRAAQLDVHSIVYVLAHNTINTHLEKRGDIYRSAANPLASKTAFITQCHQMQISAPSNAHEIQRPLVTDRIRKCRTPRPPSPRFYFFAANLATRSFSALATSSFCKPPGAGA